MIPLQTYAAMDIHPKEDKPLYQDTKPPPFIGQTIYLACAEAVLAQDPGRGAQQAKHQDGL